MTAEEKVDLKLAIELIQSLDAKLDAIPGQTRQLIKDALDLHEAKRHSRDKEVVSGFRVLMDEHLESGAFRHFCGRYWRYIVLALGLLTAVLEILERTHVIH
jgi:hypothetical protein